MSKMVKVQKTFVCVFQVIQVRAVWTVEVLMCGHLDECFHACFLSDTLFSTLAESKSVASEQVSVAVT